MSSTHAYIYNAHIIPTPPFTPQRPHPINYLKGAQRVRLADVGVLVPAAVRILDAAEAAVVAPAAHGQIDLLDAMVGGHVQRFAQLANLHHLDRLVGGHLEDVQQLAERLIVAIVLHDFVDAAEIRANVVDGVLLVEQLDFDSVRMTREERRHERQEDGLMWLMLRWVAKWVGGLQMDVLFLLLANVLACAMLCDAMQLSRSAYRHSSRFNCECILFERTEQTLARKYETMRAHMLTHTNGCGHVWLRTANLSVARMDIYVYGINTNKHTDRSRTLWYLNRNKRRHRSNDDPSVRNSTFVSSQSVRLR